jgi:hypothetical protein
MFESITQTRMTRWGAWLLGLLFTASVAAQSSDSLDWGDDESWGDDPWASEDQTWQWYGFVEGAWAERINNDPLIDSDQTLAESRLQLETERAFEDYTVSAKADFWADGVEDNAQADLRALHLDTTLGESIDLRAGRQVLTWGTGDLVFLNDLFPKDYTAFFSGRHDEYLKAPSDAIKLSWYGDLTVDAVWMPRANPNRFITGERLSSFSPRQGRRVAAPPKLDPLERDALIDDSEFALRLYQNINGTEWAGYAYKGYDKQPSAYDSQRDRTYFPALEVLGASVRRTGFGGIINAETAYHFGADHAGDDPNLPNSQWRFLAGYEHEPATNLTLGWQYYLQWTQEHEALIESLPDAQKPFATDEYRHVVTNRLTWQVLRQDLTLSMFTFFSPSDADYYLRPRAEYRFSDQLTGSVGGNVFGGEDDWTFYSQLENNSNLYARLRYQF